MKGKREKTKGKEREEGENERERERIKGRKREEGENKGEGKEGIRENVRRENGGKPIGKETKEEKWRKIRMRE